MFGTTTVDLGLNGIRTLNFGEEWGYWYLLITSGDIYIDVFFRNGTITIKPPDVEVEEGIEAKVRHSKYVYRNGNWYSQSFGDSWIGLLSIFFVSGAFLYIFYRRRKPKKETFVRDEQKPGVEKVQSKKRAETTTHMQKLWTF